MDFTGLSVADSSISGESQEARRARRWYGKKALIVTDDYIIGPEDIFEDWGVHDPPQCHPQACRLDRSGEHDPGQSHLGTESPE